MQTFREGLLEGKVAFVAGGTSGINLGIAKRYAQLGARVAVVGRNPEKAANAAREIGADALGLSADVRDYGAIRGAMQEIVSRLGKMDIVVSGAAGAVGMDPIFRELPASVSSLVGTLPIVFPSVDYFDLDRFNVATATVSQDELQMTWYDASGQVLKSLTVDAQ